MYVLGENIVCIFLYSEFIDSVSIEYIFGLLYFHTYAVFAYIYIVCIEYIRNACAVCAHITIICAYTRCVCIYIK